MDKFNENFCIHKKDRLIIDESLELTNQLINSLDLLFKFRL